MQTLSIKNIDNRHSEWKSVLGFYRDELICFRMRLEEVASKNTSKEIMQMTKHFQNQFLIQSESIDILLHDINGHLHLLTMDVQQHAGHINKEQTIVRDLLQSRFKSEQEIFRQLKAEFMRFLSKLM
jgi:hypothetical protein